MRIVVQSMDHYERLGGDCGGISSGNAPEIPGYLRRDFLGLRPRRTLTACRRGPCKVCFLSGISSLRSDIPARLRRGGANPKMKEAVGASRPGIFANQGCWES